MFQSHPANRGATLYFDVLGSLGVPWNCNPQKLKPGTSALELYDNDRYF
jgi:hypothetical protein